MKSTNSNNREDSPRKRSMSFEDKNNLVGFFELLMKIDKRNKPENYQP